MTSNNTHLLAQRSEGQSLARHVYVLSAQGLTRLSQVSAGLAFVWRLWGRVCFLLHSECWQNPGPCICRTEVLIICWLSAKGRSQLLEATCIPWYAAPSIFKASNGVLNHLALNLPDFLFRHQPEKTLLLKGSCNEAHSDNLPLAM